MRKAKCVAIVLLSSFILRAAAFADDDSAAYGQGEARKIGRRHQGAVLALAAVPRSDDFFSGGSDGFLSFHGRDGCETWQISDMPVRMISVHPDGNLVAAYESDGFSVHRLSVWKWDEKRRLYAKRFRDSITSVSWSAKGNYLMIGNTSLEGITTLSGESGRQKNIFRNSPGPVTLGITGATESSMITFGPLGRIVYTDISNGKTRASYQGPTDVDHPVLLANNSVIAGYRNSSVVTVDATTGRILAELPASGKPVMATHVTDPQPVWFERSGEDWILRSGEASSMPFFTGEPSPVTAAVSLESVIVFGNEAGKLYSMPRIDHSGALPPLTLLSGDAIRRVDDIASDGDRLYILSSGSLFSSGGPGDSPVLAFSGIKANRFRSLDESFIFWSTESPEAITLTSRDGLDRRQLYQPKEPVNSLSVFGNKVSCIEGTSRAVVFALSSGTPFTYEGAGLQDAVQIGYESLVVSKSATSRSPYPLILINTRTGETVPIPVQGELCFALKPSGTDETSLIGFIVKGQPTPATELVSITIDPSSVSSSRATASAVYPDEDLKAFLFVDRDTVLTNLGKGPLVEISVKSGRQSSISRDYALPLRAVALDRFYASVNDDGSLTWYLRKNRTIVSSVAISETGLWTER